MLSPPRASLVSLYFHGFSMRHVVCAANATKALAPCSNCHLLCRQCNLLRKHVRSRNGEHLAAIRGSGRPYFSAVPDTAQVRHHALLGFLFPVRTAGYHVNTRTYPDALVLGSRLLATGAAGFHEFTPRRRVTIVIVSHIALPTIAGQYDFRLAEATGSVDYGYSGFSACSIPTVSRRALTPSPHTLSCPNWVCSRRCLDAMFFF